MLPRRVHFFGGYIMGNGIQVFEQCEFGQVRVVNVDGEPWFVAKDVLRALEYADDYNPSRAMQAIPDEWKGVQRMHTLGGEQEMLTISEPGLYFFLGRSDKPAALPYQKWISGEVMPSIRKTGGYSMAPKTYAEALRALAAEVEMREAVEAQKALAEEQRDEAIRTKAEIGSRREATSMATASAAVRQRDALADKLGEGKHWKSVKAIPWLLEVFGPSRGMYSVVGKKLAQLGERMGKPSREIEDATYGTIKAHHVDVIEAFRLELEKDGNMMGKYRRA